MIWVEETTVKLKRKCQWCGKKANGKIIKVESVNPDWYFKLHFCCKECAKKYVDRDVKEQDETRRLREYVLGGEE